MKIRHKRQRIRRTIATLWACAMLLLLVSIWQGWYDFRWRDLAVLGILGLCLYNLGLLLNQRRF